MLCPFEPRSLIFLRNYNEMGAGPLLFVPVQRFLGTSWRYNGEKHAHFGGLMVESMLIFVFLW